MFSHFYVWTIRAPWMHEHGHTPFKTVKSFCLLLHVLCFVYCAHDSLYIYCLGQMLMYSVKILLFEVKFQESVQL